jgi:tetratricopeptide (TPR) repeat protein
VSSIDDLLEKAKGALDNGNKNLAAKLFTDAADGYATIGDFINAAKIYEKAGLIYRDLYNAYECFSAMENATLMLIRQESKPEIHQEIVRINTIAAQVAEEATEFKQAADYYFRALDFVDTEEEKRSLTIAAADVILHLANSYEENGEFSESVALLKKVSGLYYTVGDNEIGERINNRAVRLALSWAEEAKQSGDFLAAGNALAEAAQIMQNQGDSPEATKLMMEAGGLYEMSGLYEKAGNIYDAAQEVYKFLRLSSARTQAISKAAEAYLKLEGKPEVVAPLLVKAGNMFTEIDRVMKAKWAYKRGNELFDELAKKAAESGDIVAEKSYLKHQAMCLRLWGRDEEAEELYQQVTSYYLEQAKADRERGAFEAQALSLEEGAKVLLESGDEKKSTILRHDAIDIYIKLAESTSESGQPDESSKFYTRAAECASVLGDEDRAESLHKLASEKALEAVKFYEELEVPELTTIWYRAAGIEALKTNDSEMIEKAIEYLWKSAEAFEKIEELEDAFEDLFTIFEVLFEHQPESKTKIDLVIRKMDEITMATKNETIISLMSVVRALVKYNPIRALLALQEREEDLMSKRDRLRKLVELSEKSESTEESTKKSYRHWIYK